MSILDPVMTDRISLQIIFGTQWCPALGGSLDKSLGFSDDQLQGSSAAAHPSPNPHYSGKGKLPLWIPGYVNGHAICGYHTLSVALYVPTWNCHQKQFYIQCFCYLLEKSSRLTLLIHNPSKIFKTFDCSLSSLDTISFKETSMFVFLYSTKGIQ